MTLQLVPERLQLTKQSIRIQDFNELIDFDRREFANSGLPNSELPPNLTVEELHSALARGDQISWIVSDETRLGYYWTEERGDELFLSALAVGQEFRNRKIGTEVLYWVEQTAVERNLNSIGLAVVPMNMSALQLYLKSGYKVTNCAPDYFGAASPNKFRLLMKKELGVSKLGDFAEMLMIPCTEKDELLAAIQDGFLGVALDIEDEILIFKKYDPAAP